MALHSEDNQQIAVVTWFRQLQAYKQIPDTYLLVHSNNSTQGLDSYAKRRNWGRRGGLAGIPDLVLYVAKGAFYGLFIEMKSPTHKPKRQVSNFWHLYIPKDVGGKGSTCHGVTSIQSDVMSKLHQHGYQTVVCFSSDEAIRVIQSYLGLEL